MSIVFTVLKFLFPFIAGAAALAFHKAHTKEREFIQQRVRGERMRSILLHLDEVVSNVVKELAQTMADAFKLAGDGKLSTEEKKLLLGQAMSRVREYMGSHGLSELGELLRLAEGALTDFIRTKIESKVHDLKQVSPPKTSEPDIRLPAPELS